MKIFENRKGVYSVDNATEYFQGKSKSYNDMASAAFKKSRQCGKAIDVILDACNKNAFLYELGGLKLQSIPDSSGEGFSIELTLPEYDHIDSQTMTLAYKEMMGLQKEIAADLRAVRVFLSSASYEKGMIRLVYTHQKI